MTVTVDEVLVYACCTTEGCIVPLGEGRFVKFDRVSLGESGIDLSMTLNGVTKAAGWKEFVNFFIKKMHDYDGQMKLNNT